MPGPSPHQPGLTIQTGESGNPQQCRRRRKLRAPACDPTSCRIQEAYATAQQAAKGTVQNPWEGPNCLAEYKDGSWDLTSLMRGQKKTSSSLIQYETVSIRAGSGRCSINPTILLPPDSAFGLV